MNKLMNSFIWRLLERSGAQIVTFIVSIILARIIGPEEFGIIAIVLVTITILNVFVDSGLGNALIQKKDADDIDFSTVLFFNLLLGIVLYWILFALAPLISAFYNDNSLIPLLRVLGLTIVFASVKNILHAYVSRTFQFKKFFFATIGGTILSAVVGVVLAYQGYGVWALVWQHLSNTIVDTIVLWIVVNWKPQFVFSAERLKRLAKYGYKILLSSLINTLYNNFRQLIVGKFYSSSDLAYYNRGKQFPFLVVTNINISMDSVLFPALSTIQNDNDKVIVMTRKAISVSAFVMWPIIIGIFAVADRLVPLLLSEKWIDCIPYLRIFCALYLVFPIQTANLNAIKAKGYSDVFLKLGLYECLIGLVFLLLGLKKGPVMIAVMFMTSTFITTGIIQLYAKKMNGYRIREQIRDFLPQMIGALTMGLIVYLFGLLSGGWFVLLLQVLIGILYYTLFSKVFIKENFQYAISIASRFLKRAND